jgi:hypothetical protein
VSGKARRADAPAHQQVMHGSVTVLRAPLGQTTLICCPGQLKVATTRTGCVEFLQYVVLDSIDVGHRDLPEIRIQCELVGLRRRTISADSAAAGSRASSEDSITKYSRRKRHVVACLMRSAQLVLEMTGQ